MDKIVLGGKSYSKVDLKNGFTLRANHIAKKILKNTFKPLMEMQESVGELDQNNPLANIKAIDILLESGDDTAAIMALIYIEDDETYFNENTYSKRKDLFENIVLTEEIQIEMEKDIQSFFHFKMNLINTSTLTYLTASLGQIKPTLPG